MQKYYENTMQSKYIKSLLFNSFLPTIPTLSEGDIAIEGNTYILKNKICKCTKTGAYKIAPTGAVTSDIATFDFIQNYSFGSYYPKITTNHVSNTDYYDSETHEQLYKFLRCYKDIMGINLLPFYNLYSGDLTTNINIRYTDDGKGYVYSKVYDDVKLVKVKIQFNRKYTIAIDCSSEVWIAPVFMIKDYFLTRRDDEGDVSITDEFININDKVTRYNNLSFKNPIVFEVDNLRPDFARYEKYLSLIIKLPKDNESSIVVLDGDYTNICKNNVLNMENIDEEITRYELNNTLLSDLSLLQLNTNTSYPFASRLFEYLLFYPITEYDNISDNIERIQRGLSYRKSDKYTPGVWNDYTRTKAFKYSMNSNKIRHLDLNGYIDKDTESILKTY